MNSEPNDSISAFIDDELNPEEYNLIVERLSIDEASRSAVGRYQLIRAGLRGESVGLDTLQIADNLRERIAQEPTVLSPRRRSILKANVRRGAVGVAIAASVAVLAITLVPSQLRDGAGSETKVAQVPASAVISPTLGLTASNGVVSPAATSLISRRHLNALAADHNEFVVRGGAAGLMPYATFVSYNGR